MQKITPHLWFDSEAEEAAEFYTSIFKNSKILEVARYDEAAEEVSGKKAGTAMTVRFQLEGQDFMALNGGPVFKFNEAISFVVDCETQEEIDYYWEKMSAVSEAEQCGWLKDKYGVSWQIVPRALSELLSDPDPAKVHRVTDVFLKMKKFDIQKLKDAAEGK
ncbi:MAG TPA: VOC family protein [Candidatus Saccharimonadales bacterium]